MAPGIGIAPGSPMLRKKRGINWSSYWTQQELLYSFDGTVLSNYLVNKSGIRSDTPENGYKITTANGTTLTHTSLPSNAALIDLTDRPVSIGYSITTGVLTFLGAYILYHFKLYVDGVLWGEYPVCESSGNTLYDISGNGRHLTISLGTGAWATQTVVINHANDYGYTLSGDVRIPALRDLSAAASGVALTNKGKVKRNALLLDVAFSPVATLVEAIYVDFNPEGVTEAGFELFNRSDAYKFAPVVNALIYNEDNYVFAVTELTNVFIKNSLHAVNFNKFYFNGLSEIYVSKDDFSDEAITYLGYGSSDKAAFGSYFRNLYHFFDNTPSTITSTSWAHKIWSGVVAKHATAAPTSDGTKMNFATGKRLIFDDIFKVGEQGTILFKGSMPVLNSIILGIGTAPTSYLIREAAGFDCLVNASSRKITYTHDSNEHIFTFVITKPNVYAYIDGVLYDSAYVDPTNVIIRDFFYKVLGGYSDATFGSLNGTLYKLAIFNKAILNTTELSALALNLFGDTVSYASNVNICYDGDSITAGTGLSSPTTERFSILIMNSLGLGGYGLIGGTGGTTQQGLYDINRSRLVYIPDCTNNIFVDFMGANNHTDADYTNTYNFKKSMCLEAKRLGFKTITVGMLPRSANLITEQTEAQLAIYNGLNGLLRADNSFADAFVDVAADETIGVAGSQMNATYYQDGTHPTAAGHLILQSLIEPVIQSLIV